MNAAGARRFAWAGTASSAAFHPVLSGWSQTLAGFSKHPQLPVVGLGLPATCSKPKACQECVVKELNMLLISSNREHEQYMPWMH